MYCAELYIHELDIKAKAALDRFQKFVDIQKAYIEKVDERKVRYELLSNGVRLSDNQMPEIYNLLPPICEKLGIDVPELYYVNSRQINAATIGTTNTFIYITSALVEKLPKDLIGTVLAHECGHIACGHYLYHSMAASLINGVEHSPWAGNKAICRFITPALIKTLLFWDRCSELSADRAAALCDGNADKTVDVLLLVNGYETGVNREEFISQALDLKSFVAESDTNKIIEQMIVQGESHPRLATRVYECCEWAKSNQYSQIISGTYSLGQRKHEIIEQEILTAEIEAEAQGRVIYEQDVDAALQNINKELIKYTDHNSPEMYAVSVIFGLWGALMDILFVEPMVITEGDIAISHKSINRFIQRFAGEQGLKNTRLKDAVAELEKAFKVAQDNVWKGADIRVSAINHHLADLAHHPTPIGLVAALIVQFLRVGIFFNRDGEWHLQFVKTSKEDIIQIVVPAIITGVLNWLVCIAEESFDDEDSQIKKAFFKLAHTVASIPMISEIVKCANNWFGHLVSDMGGSKSTAGDGMGIPGIFVSLLYELSGLPILKDSGLPEFVNGLYQKGKLDLRHELPAYKALGKQAVPVIMMEVMIRAAYFAGMLASVLKEKIELKNVNWEIVLPFNNRTVERMITVATMTFTTADTADAAVHAAIESGANWALFAGKFVTRFNYAAAGRAAIAIVKDVSMENREAELLHEKMLLTEMKTTFVVEKIEKYKAWLEEKLSNYIAEDIEAFLNGFDMMNEGIQSGDSNLIIKGNVTIQRVLGREPQFTNQQEFDDLMESDALFVF